MAGPPPAWPPGRWLSPVLLELIAPPPARLVVVRGARRGTVTGPATYGPPEWHDITVLAWARIPAGGWGALTVWDGMAQAPGDRQPMVHARWSWCRWTRCKLDHCRPTPPDNPWGLSWLGLPRGYVDEAAIEQAAATLPPHLRQAAVTPWIPPEERDY